MIVEITKEQFKVLENVLLAKIDDLNRDSCNHLKEAKVTGESDQKYIKSNDEYEIRISDILDLLIEADKDHKPGIVRGEACRYIATTYGLEPQMNQIVEEMAELTVAINKYRRARLTDDSTADVMKRHNTREDVIDEIADVSIMIEQLIYLMSVDDKVKRKIMIKLDRQLNRIKRSDAKD